MTSLESDVINGLYDNLLLSDIDPGQVLGGFLPGAYGFAAVAVRDAELGQKMLVQNRYGVERGNEPKLYVVDRLRNGVSLINPLEAGIGDLAVHWTFIKMGGGASNFRDATFEADKQGWHDANDSLVAKKLAEFIVIGMSPRLFELERV